VVEVELERGAGEGEGLEVAWECTKANAASRDVRVGEPVVGVECEVVLRFAPLRLVGVDGPRGCCVVVGVVRVPPPPEPEREDEPDPGALGRLSTGDGDGGS
jgi:hypothetical protein